MNNYVTKIYPSLGNLVNRQAKITQTKHIHKHIQEHKHIEKLEAVFESKGKINPYEGHS